MDHGAAARIEQGDRLHVVIIGGGTAGWMTAAALVKLLPRRCNVTLVESEAIGIVGVGEATLPHIRAFNTRIGIDEAEFVRETRATFKLGIEFCDWHHLGDGYFHPFSPTGRAVDGIAFHHLWRRASAERLDPGSFDAFALAAEMARQGRFAPPPADGGLPPYGYAYQFDATRFAPLLRRHAEAAGAERIEGRVATVDRDAATGNIAALRLDDGRTVAGDLFIDCSGFAALLIGRTLAEPFEGWSRWLPCDRAVAMPCRTAGAVRPYTTATAMPSGWRWRIPLQHRTGNGYVYASAFTDEASAGAALAAAIEGEPLAAPRPLRFTAGRRTRSWVGNCIAIGLAGGFLEPLESTSIHLIQLAITALVELFPERRIADIDRDAFNRQMDETYAKIRDFLILHYHATDRDDSPFWRHIRATPIPDSLADRLALFRRTGLMATHQEGVFLEPSWIAVALGQRLVPDRHDLRADRIPAATLARGLAALRRGMIDEVAAMPSHDAALSRYGAAA